MTQQNGTRPQVITALAKHNITSYYCGFIGCIVFGGKLWLRACMSHDPGDSGKFKFPGGMSDAYEHPRDVGAREYRQEATRKGTSVYLDIKGATLICQAFGPCQNTPGGNHAKLFYLFSEEILRGTDRCFRTSLHLEDDGTILTPFIPMEISLLWELIFISHRPALAAAIVRLSMDREYFPMMGLRLVVEAQNFLQNEFWPRQDRVRNQLKIPLDLDLSQEL